MRRVSIVLLALGMTACFSPQRSADVIDAGPSRTATGEFDPASTTATMTSGTEVVRGVIARACVDDACSTIAGAAPEGRLEVSDAEPLLTIALERQPQTVEGIIRRGERIVSRTSLHPGTLVAWMPELPEGRSQLRLLVGWPRGSTLFVFQLRRR